MAWGPVMRTMALVPSRQAVLGPLSFDAALDGEVEKEPRCCKQCPGLTRAASSEPGFARRPLAMEGSIYLPAN